MAKYFKKELSLATGIVCMGASLGIIYTGPLVQVLIDSFEWRGTFRIMAATFVLVCLLSLNFNPNVQETSAEDKEKNDSSGDDNSQNDDSLKVSGEKDTGITRYCNVWKNPTYAFIVISLTFGSFGLFIPIMYLVRNNFVHIFVIVRAFFCGLSFFRY